VEPIAVTDARDPRLADYVELADPAARRRRERDELFVVEGVTAIERLVVSGHRVRSVLVTPKVHRRLATALGALDAPVYVAEPAVLEATVGFSLHRGAVAAAARRPWPDLAEVLAGSRRLAVLEGLNDPENLGAVARSARALGIDGALIDLNRALSDKIAKGEVDLQTPGLSEHLWQTTMDKLAVDQPNYASYKRELGKS
jgi:tRNA G18 (ribose-2'-O)-methylase SpoU